MRLIRLVCMALVAVVVLALGGAAAAPRGWSITRSIVIEAPAHKVHQFVGALQRWPEWSAWNKEFDPHARRTFSGPQEGAGSAMSWLGPKLGHGRVTIASASLAEGLVLDEAIESEVVNAHARITYAAEGSSTRVTWTDEGTLPIFAGVYRGRVEAELATQVERSLANLKRVVEQP